MALKILSLSKRKILQYFVLLFFIVFSKNAYAQCAGIDTSVTVCDIENVVSQNFNLFDLLGPTAVSGGVWTDLAQTQALNLTTGVLNLWNVQQSGIYTFTYTVPSSECADNTAEVIVTVGGYTGVTSPNGSACNNDNSVNLFQFFVGGNVPSPQFSGEWFDNDNTGAVSGSTLNATIPPLGTYSFTYRIAAIGSCPAQESTSFVTIYPAPKSGVGTVLLLCESDDLTQYSNFNLLNLLSGEDQNGQWTELNTTTEIANPFDSFVNIQNIYNTYGAGIYAFSYRVLPLNPICTPQFTEVRIIIKDFIDLSDGDFSVDSICQDAIATADIIGTITEGINDLPNVSVKFNYQITGPNSQSGTTEGAISSGVLTFSLTDLPLGNPFTEVGAYTINVSNIIIVEENDMICDHIMNLTTVFNIYPLPYFTNAQLTIPTVCSNSDATVNISGVGNLADGDYQLTYDLFASNKAFNQIVVVSVVNGIASFTIPSALIPNIGNTTLFITNVLDLQTGCTVNADNFKTFIVVDPPFVANVTIQVDNGCQNVSNTVTVTDLGILTNVMITYNLTGANVASDQTATFNAVLGNASFVIPASLLPNDGFTTITIINIKDLVTGCSINTTIPATFFINTSPNVNSLIAVTPNVCKNEVVSISVSGLGDLTSVNLTYTITGSNTTTPQTITLVPIDGNATFVVPATFLPNSGATIFTITAIENEVTGCISTTGVTANFNINPLPDVANFSVSIPTVCQNQAVSVLFSNINNVNILTFEYQLSGANTATTQTATIAITGGNAVFVIPAGLLLNTGATTFTLTNALNAETFCSTTANITRTFNINPLPDVSNFSVQIANVCKNQSVQVALTGLVNVNTFSIVYALSGANNLSNETITLVANSGNANFIIPANFLPNSGATLLIISNINNTQTNCETPVTNVSDTFSILDLPNPPLAEDAFFCQEQDPVVANLIPNGDSYKWYDSAAATTPLPNDFPLVPGSYFVTQTDAITGCESLKTEINVTTRELATPILIANGENFCGANDPTLLDLSNNITADETIVWYDAPENGNLLPNSQLLEEATTYYGFQFSATTNCTSAENVAVTVSLTDCDEEVDGTDFFIPDGFSPNGDTVNDTFRIPDIEFLFPDYTLEIYNRYGSLLFKGNINKPSWDGKNADAKNTIDGIAPNGVYFYIVNFNKNNAAPKQGRLYLNR